MSLLTYAEILQATPNVANAADRSARFPNPGKFQKIYRIDTGDIEQWTGASWEVIFAGGLGHLVLDGTGSPEGVKTASPGALYLQTDGANGTVVWFKNSGSGNTGWRPLQSSLGVFNVKDYGAVGDGTTDDTTAIQAALDAAAAAGGGVVEVPTGLYKFTSSLTVGEQITLRGRGYAISTGASNRAPACLLKNGTFTGVDLTGASSGLEMIQVDGDTANGGDGIRIANQRCHLRDVSSTSHGGVGVRIGITTTNCNLWRISNLITVGNGSHGLYIHDPDASAPDVNAGLLMGLDSRSNGGDGLSIDNAFDNNYFGVQCASNTGYGVHCVGTASLKSTGQAFWFPYTETNTAGDVLLDTYSNYCVLFGYRTGSLTNDSVVNSGTANLVFGHYGSIKPGPLFRSVIPGTNDSPLAAELFRVSQSVGANLSGYYDVYKDGTTRGLVFQLNGTTATPVEVTFDHADASGHLNLTLADGHLTQYVNNPSALAAGANNNYVPGEAATLLVTCDSTGSTITGIQVNTAGRRLRLVNISSSASLTIAHQNTGTTPSGYRIITPAGVDMLVRPNASVDLEYDSVTGRWRVDSGLGSAARFIGSGTAHVAGDYALSAGWGNTATVSTVAARDTGGRVSITCGGTGIAANPTVTLTYKDGTWTTVPTCVPQRADINAPATAPFVPTSDTATTFVLTFLGTPVSGTTYTFSFHVVGK